MCIFRTTPVHAMLDALSHGSDNRTRHWNFFATCPLLFFKLLSSGRQYNSETVCIEVCRANKKSLDSECTSTVLQGLH